MTLLIENLSKSPPFSPPYIPFHSLGRNLSTSSSTYTLSVSVPLRFTCGSLCPPRDLQFPPLFSKTVVGSEPTTSTYINPLSCISLLSLPFLKQSQTVCRGTRSDLSMILMSPLILYHGSQTIYSFIVQYTYHCLLTVPSLHPQ